MSLDQLIAISKKAGMKDVTPLVLEYETLKLNYHPPEKAILVYLTSHHIHGDSRGFIPWYVDHMEIFDPKYVKRMENRHFQPRHEQFDPHKFP